MTLLDKNSLHIGDVEHGIQFDFDPADKFLTVKIGKETARVKYVDLWGVVYALGDERQMEQITPVRQTEVMVYERVHNVKLKKNMRAGEIMKVRCKIDVPVTIVEGLAGFKEKAPSKIISLAK